MRHHRAPEPETFGDSVRSVFDREGAPLCDDMLAFAARAAAAERHATLTIEPGVLDVWPAFVRNLPASGRAVAAVADFVAAIARRPSRRRHSAM